jgi:hypothetical protein
MSWLVEVSGAQLRSIPLTLMVSSARKENDKDALRDKGGMGFRI